MNKTKKLLATVCLALLCSNYSVAQTSQTTVTNPSISDDSFANVPLQFNFPLHGQNFNNSWMFSNGVVSFQDPNKSGMAWSNLSVQPFSSTMGSQFDYSIYALWTDLINIKGSFRTEGNNTFQRYSWMGISPFYDANRLNTFSIEIRPDGKIITNYTEINVNYAVVGVTGNTSKGEFEQINYFGSSVTTGMIQNWERGAMLPDPCLDNKLSSPSCPGYLEELAKLSSVPTIQTTEIFSVTPTSSAVATTTTELVPVITTVSSSTADRTSTSPSTTITSTASTSVVASVVNPVSSPSSSTSSSNSSGSSIGLSVIARNQQREQAIAMQASQTAIAAAEQASQQTQQEALSVANQAVSNSFSMAQNATRTTTSSSEIKTTTNNTDLTFQNNQSSSSVNLFASPVTQTAQRQSENNQNNVVAVVTTTTQSNRTNQSNQQSTTSDTSSRPVALQSNVGMGASVETEIKPPVMSNTVKVTDIASNVVQSTQETTTQQTQPTFVLLPPQTAVTVQQSTTQKPTVDVKQEATVNLLQQETSVTQQSTLYSLLPPQPIQQIIQQNTVIENVQPAQISLFSSQPTITNTNENNTSDSQKMLLDRSNPVFQTLENKNVESQSNTPTQTGLSVNRNVQNNEVAGGVDINRMALAPAGYNEYLNLTLRDAAFYAPKEIYKNQKTIDNARALRQLSSDRLHQEMVEQQYKRN